MKSKQKILIGDVRDTISKIEDNSIQVMNTSPPYFNLRNYKGNTKQLGLEATANEFITNLADIFDLLKPKMKSTGTMWINLGDTIKNGEQMLIPERFAIEMVSRGYKLINQVVWYKPSAMPCSAKRRMGVDYEKLYLFALSDDYYFNMMKHPYKTATIKTIKTMPPIGGKKHTDASSSPNYTGNTPEYKEGANTRCVWSICPSRNKDKHFATQAPEISRRAILMGSKEGDLVCDVFHGLGTTMASALSNSRNYIGCELNKEYVEAGLKKWKLQAEIEGENR